MYKKEIIVAINLMGYAKNEISGLLDSLIGTYNLFPRVAQFRIFGTQEYLDLCNIDDPKIYSKIKIEETLPEVYSSNFIDNNDYYMGLFSCLLDSIKHNSNIIVTANINNKVSNFVNNIMLEEYANLNQEFYDLPVFQMVPTKMGDAVICGISDFTNLTNEKLQYYLDIASHASNYVRGVVFPRVGIIDLFEEIPFLSEGSNPKFFYKGKVSGCDLVDGNVDVVVAPIKITKFLVDLIVGTGQGAIHLLNNSLNNNFLGNLCKYFGHQIFKSTEEYYSKSYSVNSIMWSGMNNSVIALHEPNISTNHLIDVIMFSMQIHAYARLINK